MVDRNDDRGQQEKSQMPVPEQILTDVSLAGATASEKEMNEDSMANSNLTITRPTAIVTGKNSDIECKGAGDAATDCDDVPGLSQPPRKGRQKAKPHERLVLVS